MEKLFQNSLQRAPDVQMDLKILNLIGLLFERRILTVFSQNRRSPQVSNSALFLIWL